MAVDLANLVIKVSQDGVSQAQSGLDGLTRSGANAERSVGTLTTATGGLVSALAKIAAAVGGVYAVQRAFQAGIRAVDDFRVSVIGIAATLTDMAKPGQGSMETVFARNKAAAEDMYKAITVEAAKHFSSASEGMMVYNRLVQSGYSVQKSEVSDLLLLTDKIKLATRGQNVEMQLNTEIIALMSGQAKAQSMIAMELQSRLGSGWGELVKKHREAGDLLQWIASLFPGLVTANKEIEGTLNAQWATTKSLLDLLAIGGLAGAYDDIVNLLKQANEQLRSSEGLVHAIARAWEGVRDVAKATWGFISEIYNVVSKAITWTIKISTSIIGPAANFLAGGAGPQGDFGFGALGPTPATRKLTSPWQTGQLAAAGVSAFIPGANGELIPVYGAEGMAGVPPIKTVGRGAGDKSTGGGGGGKGTDAAESAMKSFIETMKSETARAAGDTEAILGAWYGKQLLAIEKWKNAGLDTTEALSAADAAYYSKLEKLNSDFADWYNSNMGNQYEKLVAEETKKLATVTGNKAKEAQVIEAYDRKHFELSQQMETERTNLFKGYLDTMAGLSPVLADQLGYKREALSLELKLADAALERSRREGKITQDTYEQAQAMQAVVAQAKKYNLEMENNKGIQGWAYARVKADSQKNTWADAMEGLEGFVTDVFSQGIQGALSKTKVDFMEVAKTMAQSLVLNLAKQGIHKAFGGLAELIAGGGPGKLGSSKMNPMWVTFDGMGLPGVGKATGAGAAFDRTVEKAGKIGFSMGGGGDQAWDDQAKQLKTYDKLMDKMYKGQLKDMGGIQRLQERFFKDDIKDLNAYGQMQEELIQNNQEMFKSDYLTQYQSDFTTMTTGITSIWGISQAAMTAAGASGEAQRYGTMVSYGIQGLSFLYDVVTKGTLAKAWAAGSAAYSSTWEFLGFPAAVVVAPLMAAIAFAGTLAAGSGGGGGGSVEPGSFDSSLMMSSAGGDYQVTATGPRLVHQEETILPPWAAEGWRNIVSREASGDKGGGGGTVIHAPITFAPVYNYRPTQADMNRDAKMMVKAINKTGGVGTRGQKIGSGRY